MSQPNFLSEEQLEQLVTLAAKATPGPWRTGYPSGRCTIDTPGHRHGEGSCDYRLRWHDAEIGGIYTDAPEGAPFSDAQLVATTDSDDDGGWGPITNNIKYLAALPPEVLRSLVAEVRALRKEKAERDAREPDYCYDDEWECSYHWSDRDALCDDHSLASGEIRRVGTLFSGPDRYVAEIPIAFDDEGDPDDWEARWFNTEEEAQAAIDAARAEGV